MQQLKQFTKHNGMWNATNITRVKRAGTCCQSRNAISCWRLTVCEVKSTCLRSQLSSASRLMLFPNLAYNWTFKSPRTPWMDDTRPSRALISSCRASCGEQNGSMEILSATSRFHNIHSASKRRSTNRFGKARNIRRQLAGNLFRDCKNEIINSNKRKIYPLTSNNSVKNVSSQFFSCSMVLR